MARRHSQRSSPPSFSKIDTMSQVFAHHRFPIPQVLPYHWLLGPKHRITFQPPPSARHRELLRRASRQRGELRRFVRPKERWVVAVKGREALFKATRAGWVEVGRVLRGKPGGWMKVSFGLPENSSLP